MGLALGAAFYISGHRGQKLPSGAGAQADYDTGQTLLDRYYKAGNIDSAIALFQKTVKENPQFASGYAGLGRAWWEKYRDKRDSSSIEPARAASSQAIELDREIPSAHVTLGLIYTNAGKTDLAAGELKEALRLNSRSADAYSALADLYKEEGRTADVEPAIQKAIDFAPGAWRYLNQLGLYYLSTGNYAAAAQQFQQATALNSDNAHAWNNLALAYLRQYRLDQARTACENSLRIEPTYYPSLSNLGEVLEFEGRNAEAVEVYRRAVAVNPSSYMSWGNLASAQNRIPGGKPQARETYLKAISVAEQARAKAPDDPGVVATLGSFYAGVGVDGKSTPMLRQAAALAPDNPQILYKVAEGYELLHRRADALQWIGKAIQAGLPRETVERNPELAALKADPAFPSGK
jgi:tetratricopeptide (TPR) repeat protein